MALATSLVIMPLVKIPQVKTPQVKPPKVKNPLVKMSTAPVGPVPIWKDQWCNMSPAEGEVPHKEAGAPTIDASSIPTQRGVAHMGTTEGKRTEIVAFLMSMISIAINNTRY